MAEPVEATVGKKDILKGERGIKKRNKMRLPQP